MTEFYRWKYDFGRKSVKRTVSRMAFEIIKMFEVQNFKNEYRNKTKMEVY